MKFNVEIEGMKTLQRQLDPRLVKKAMAPTLNELAKTTKTQTAKLIILELARRIWRLGLWAAIAFGRIEKGYLR